MGRVGPLTQHPPGARQLHRAQLVFQHPAAKPDRRREIPQNETGRYAPGEGGDQTIRRI